MKKLLSLALTLVMVAGLMPGMGAPAAVASGSELNWIVPLSAGYDIIAFFSDGLAHVIKDNKMGFIDTKGNVVIPLIYDGGYQDEQGNWRRYYRSDFQNGMAPVVKDGKLGFIDTKGNVVVPFKYNTGYEDEQGRWRHDRSWFWRNELYQVFSGGKFGFIDETGNEVVPVIYDIVVEVGEHKTENRVSFNYDSNGNHTFSFMSKNGDGEYKWGLIDKTGKVILPFEYDNPVVFYDGLAWANGEYINKAGTPVITGFTNGRSFLQGFASAMKDGSMHIIDTAGDIVLSLGTKYTDAWHLAPGYFAVSTYNGSRLLYGLIDKTGKEVLALEYNWFDYHDYFNERMLFVSKGGNFTDYKEYYGEGAVGTYFNLETGKLISDLIYECDPYGRTHAYIKGLGLIRKNGKWGFIDKTGKEVIPPQYDMLESFWSWNEVAAYTKGNKVGLMDKTGKSIVELDGYDRIFNMGTDDLAIVEKDEIPGEKWKYGLINTKGGFLIPAEWDDLAPLWWQDEVDGKIYGERGLVSIWREGKAGLVKVDLTQVIGADGSILGTVSTGTGLASGNHINLTAETVTLPSGFTVEAWSVDGGKKWKAGALPEGARLAKLFDKGMTLWVTDNFNKKDIKEGKKVVDKKGPAKNANIVKFPKIDRRPKANSEKLRPVYQEEVTAVSYRAYWQPLKGTAPPALAYEFSLSANGKTPDDAWAVLPSNGFDLKAAGTKETYIFRTIPVADANTNKYVPGSKTFRLKPKALVKAPNLKANEKKGILKTKKDFWVQPKDAAAVKYTSATELKIVSAAPGNNQLMQNTEVILWAAATGKKPPSEKQSLTLPAAPTPAT
jgi:hypothetical protein